MRLRSIPPRTMETLAAERVSTPTPARIIQLRQNLVALHERLRAIGAGDDPSTPRSASSVGLRPETVGRAPDAHSGGSRGGYDRVHQRPSRQHRSIDFLIPPRPRPGSGTATHTASEVLDGIYVVRIEFPVPVRPEEIRWELHEDVLEVEYLGQALTYYHAFLVPAGVRPVVEQSIRALVFRFLKQ